MTIECFFCRKEIERSEARHPEPNPGEFAPELVCVDVVACDKRINKALDSGTYLS